MRVIKRQYKFMLVARYKDLRDEISSAAKSRKLNHDDKSFKEMRIIASLLKFHDIDARDDSILDI